jgi:TldD protein
MTFNRREFLKTGGLALMGAIISPSVYSSNGGGKPRQIDAVLAHFGVSEEDLRKVLTVALEKGGDYADLFFEHTFNNSLSLRDGEVNSVSSGIDYGVGVRVLSGDQTGYAYVENTTLEDMLNAARTAARIASKAPSANVNEMGLKIPSKNYYTVKQSWEDVSVKKRIPYLQKINERVFALDPRVNKVIVGLSDSSSHILFVNSEGVMYYDYRPMAGIYAVCIMQEKDEFENGTASRSFRTGFEFLNDDLVEEIAKEAVAQASILFKAKTPKGGEMPVVLGAGGSGIFLHEAIGHAFEADFNRKGTSIFSDMLHKKVCADFINVVDDGTILFNRGSVNIDDEGAEGQKTYIVRNGILNSYLHDRISSKYYSVSPTGNGRRESFRSVPIPRMRATYMENGNSTEEEMIASIKKGVFVNTFTNGEVQIGDGDFTFFVITGYMIDDGKLTQPIKDINIIGNGPRALADITMVSGNYLMDNGIWTCGKDGQSCPVTCGMPSALISKLTVGGLS